MQFINSIIIKMKYLRLFASHGLSFAFFAPFLRLIIVAIPLACVNFAASASLSADKQGVLYLYQDNDTLSIDNIRLNPGLFTAGTYLQTAWKKHARWDKILLQHNSSRSKEVVIASSNRYARLLRVYVYISDSLVFFDEASYGIRNQYCFSGHISKFKLPPGSTAECYIYADSPLGGINFTPSFYSGSSFRSRIENFLVFTGLYFGFLLFTFIFSLANIGRTRNVASVYFASFVFCVILVSSNINGLLFSMFDSVPHRLSDLLFAVSIYACLFSFWGFLSHSLRLKSNLPAFYKALQYYLGLLLPISILLSVNSPARILIICVFSAFMLVLYLFFASASKVLKGWLLSLSVVGVFLLCGLLYYPASFMSDIFISYLILMALMIVLVSIFFHVSLVSKNKQSKMLQSKLLRSFKLLRESRSEIYSLRSEFSQQKNILLNANIDKDKLQNQLLEANKMETIGRLAGGIAHDFNNILTPIMGHAELAIETVADDEIKEDLQIILKSAIRAKDLVNQILTFSRGYKCEPVSVDVGTVIFETVDLLTASLPKNISLEYSYPATKLYALANDVQLQQVILNLCANAKDAIGTEKGFIRIKQEEFYINLPTDTLTEGAYAKITISDTGTGIDPEMLDNIFYPFYTTKPKGMGTGLGLSVAHGIVTGYGGAILPHSTIGKGTSFCIFLPLASMPDVKVNGNKTGAHIHIAKMSGKILVVDDELSIRTMMCHRLARLGFSTDSASNGKEALSIVNRQIDKYDIIITDQMMPEMQGDQLIRELKKIEYPAKLILMTGYSERFSDIDASEILADQILAKPFEFASLISSLSKLLSVS
jgi:signal transduction histidine kinase/ActR/RegA family two-component response regulator